MAEELSQIEIERLIRLSDASRSCLTAEYKVMRDRFDVPARLRNSLKTHPTGWLLGALAAGFFVTTLFRRKPAKHSIPSPGIPLTILGIAVAAAKPALKIWLGGELKKYFSKPRATRDELPYR